MSAILLMVTPMIVKTAVEATDSHQKIYCSPTQSIQTEIEMPLDAYGVCAAASASEKARGLLDMLTPEIIAMYEENIAKEQFITSIRPAKLDKMAEALGISTQKLKVIMIMKDVAGRTGTDLSLKDLATYSDAQIMKEGRKYIEAYVNTLSEEEKKLLGDKFKTFTKK